MTSNNENYNLKKGVLCILTAGMGFSLMSLFVRMSGELPVYEKAFFRNIVAAVISVYMLIKKGELFRKAHVRACLISMRKKTETYSLRFVRVILTWL